jgi:hypothetical protein
MACPTVARAATSRAIDAGITPVRLPEATTGDPGMRRIVPVRTKEGFAKPFAATIAAMVVP